MRGTTVRQELELAGSGISIHVPREGDDLPIVTLWGNDTHISIHVPREGDDSRQAYKNVQMSQFQSTSPVRGTTQAASSFRRIL